MKEPIKNWQFSSQLFDVFENFENRGYTRIGYLIVYFHGYLSQTRHLNVCDDWTLITWTDT